VSSGFGYYPHCGFVLIHKGRCVKCGSDAVVLIDEAELPETMRDSDVVKHILKIAEWKSMIRVTP